MQKTGFQMLNEDEIVTSVQEESDPVDDKTDEYADKNNESSKGPSNADAFSALETAMEWYEQQSECCHTQLLLLEGIRDLADKKRRSTMGSVRERKLLAKHLANLNLGHVTRTMHELAPLSPNYRITPTGGL
ncbi:uncharacterized protein TNCV_1715451 [Trichonephila clavipes]|nr:uncharacterized protein TNCV_1715451 [Trichonephila clavipes]